MRKAIKVSGQKITELRTRAGVTQKALAQKVGVDPGTVNRWERGKLDRVRPDVFGRLCRALRAGEAELQTEPTSRPIVVREEPDPSQLNVTVESAVRNAFSLVASKYGISPTSQIEMAPLLFTIFAEMSLKRRRENLTALEQKIWHAVSDAAETRRQFRHLPGVVMGLDYNNTGLVAGKESVGANDVFGMKIPPEATPEVDDDDYDDDLANPFEILLAEFAPQNVEIRRIAPNAVDYYVCRDPALDLVGANIELAEFILSGRLLLRDVPRELWRKDRLEDRISWIREKYRDSQDQIAELEKMLDPVFKNAGLGK